MPPLCPKCKEADSLRTCHAGKRSHGIGRLRPRIVLYNEHNPDEEAIGAVVTSDLRTRPDAIIVVGTSMKIPGVKRIVREMCGVVRGRQNGGAVWINRDPVPVAKEFEDCWDLVVKGDSDEVARRVNLKEWDDDDNDDHTDLGEEYTLSEVERVEARQGPISVVIPRTPSKVKNAYSNLTGVLTPPTSHEDELSDRGQGTKIEVSIPAEAPKMQNPASKGRTILDVLSKENRPKGAGRPKGSLNKKTKSNAGTVGQSTITGRVTKHNKSFDRAGKVEHDSHLPPLSVRPNINPVVMFPNLSQHSSAEPSPSPSPAPESRKATTWSQTPDTISPSGRLPSGMKALLN